MKFKFYLPFIVLMVLAVSAIGQNFQGAEAERLISGSDFVRFGEKSELPEFVRFHESAQFPASEFPAWAKKAFRLPEGIGLQEVSHSRDKNGFTHIKYELSVNGISVFGAFYIAHIRNDMVVSANGKIPNSAATASPSISESTALQSAMDQIGAESYKWQLEGEEAHLKWEKGNPDASYFPKGKLVYINPNFDFKETDALRLAYMFDIYAHKPVGRYEVFVSAENGNVLFTNDRICSADVPGTAVTGYSGNKTIIADSFGGGYRLRENGRGGGIRTFDMNTGTNYGNAVDFTDGDNFWNNANGNLDQYATDGHWGAEMTYDYYLDEHGRNSIDDNNMQINSYVHYDDGYFNAFWDGDRMTYGDGNNTPLTALDICGHEMTHGVTDFTANLIYQDEYGALNESYSDIFGAAVEWVKNPSSGDWLMGEDVGTLRSMSNPNALGDPDTYDGNNWYTGTNDNGGVHTNSGVQNKWFVILTDGESGTNDLGDTYNVTGIGLSDASAIAYRTLTVYLGPTSEYADARFYSIQAAIDLFGGCSPEVIATTDAWYAVGVGDPFDAIVESDFAASVTSNCEAPIMVDFTNFSANGASYLWDFGDGNTSTAVNPSHTYISNGVYTVSLSVDGGNCGTDDLIIPNYISIDPNNPCVALMPDDGSQTLTWCTGTLYDDGGPNNNYMDENSVVTTISPAGATSITLNFSSFAFEEGYDYLYVYDGPTTNSPLIGQYDGFGLPNGGTITSSGGDITIRQFSDIYVNEAGFALSWECTQPNSPPTANFTSSVEVTCNGEVSFTDQSINGATSWLWDFGDGNTSTDQNPTHTYQNEGTYTVTLTATNGFGSDAVSYNNLIVVDRPDGPSAAGAQRCDIGTVDLTATAESGSLIWYDQVSGGSSVGAGSTFTTPSLNSTTSYYVEEVVSPATYNVGPTDNSFGGGGNFEGDQHLVFDCLSAFTLQTVKVYAQGGGNRTIQLRDNGGNVLQSTTIFIPNGEQTVTLNFDVQPGNNYQLGTTPDPDLYRNNAGPNYPYTVQDVVSIETSSAGNDYYYFFYDWEIETPGCTTERTEVLAEIVTAPSTVDASRCGTGSVALSATGNGDINWYDSPSGGNLVNTGANFNTPSLSSTTTYYVESDLTPSAEYVGPTDNTFGGGSNFQYDQHLIFDCYEAVTLVSVKVYAQGAGNRTIELRNSGGTVLQSAVINIPDGESRITLNFDLPVGTDLQLGANPGPDLYRNDSGPSYPYTIPGLVSITTSSAGNDYYYYFYDWELQRDGCITSRAPVTATIDPTPTVSVSGNTTICEGESVTLTANATDADSYQWNPSSETDSEITVSPTVQTTYEVTVSNACGDATDEITVNVNALPTLTAPADAAICFGESVQLSASGSGDFEWQPGGETDPSISVSPQSNTTYTVTSSNNCGSVSEDVDVVVNSLPNADAGQDTEVCEGESVQLTASGGTDYEWNTGATTTSIDVQPAQTASYSVMVSDANGCTDTDDVEVTVNTLPTADAGTDQEICEGESATLTASGGGNYTWSTGDEIASIAVQPSQTSTYTVTVTDGTNCSDTDDVEVVVNPLPNADAGADQEICEGESVTLTASGGGDYSWSTGDEIASISVEPTQTATYTVTVTDGNNCSDTDEVEVVVNPLPNADAGVDQEICEGENVTLNASGDGSYSWSTGDEIASISVEPAQTATYTVTVTDGNNCSDTDEVEVVVNPSPSADAGADQEICEGDIVTLTASGGETYLWDNQETTESIEVGPTGTQTYSVEVTSAENCTTIAEVTVTVNGLPTQPIVTPSGAGLELTSGEQYQWYLNGEPIENANGQTFEPSEPGDYTVEVFDSNGCSSISEPYSWIATGIASVDMALSISPNPFRELLTISASEQINEITVFDVGGRLVFRSNPNADRVTLSTQDWASGIYHLQVRSSKGVSSEKMVKAN